MLQDDPDAELDSWQEHSADDLHLPDMSSTHVKNMPANSVQDTTDNISLDNLRHNIAITGPLRSAHDITRRGRGSQEEI